MTDILSKTFGGVTFEGAKQNDVSIEEAQRRQAESRKRNSIQLQHDSTHPTGSEVDLTNTFDHAKKLHNPRFLVSSSGYISPVPNWAIGPFPTRNEGVHFKHGSGGHGFDSRTTSVRVMGANWNQGKRTIYENNARPDPQIVDPFTGKTNMEKGHFYHDKKPK